jgi:hypothetical protein
MFAGLMSRCTTPASKACCSASHSGMKSRSAWRSPIFFFSFKSSASDGPSTSSIAYHHSPPAVWPMSIALTMPGCARRAVMRASRCNRATAFLRAESSGCSTLIATGRSTAICVARYTTPVAPRPITACTA